MTLPYTPTTPPVDDPTVFPALAGQNFPVKSPIWSTRLATAASGRERRGRAWSYPKWLFKVSYEVLRSATSFSELQRLVGFFNNHAGRFATFSYYDPNDNLVTDQLFATGDGATKTFHLIRTGGYGQMTWVEPVKAVLGTPKVSVGASDTTAFTIGSLGTITFTTAPASGAALTWSGQFMFRCRFDQDQLDAEQMMQALWSQGGLSFITDKR